MFVYSPIIVKPFNIYIFFFIKFVVGRSYVPQLFEMHHEINPENAKKKYI